jgi:hypothetical protein
MKGDKDEERTPLLEKPWQLNSCQPSALCGLLFAVVACAVALVMLKVGPQHLSITAFTTKLMTGSGCSLDASYPLHYIAYETQKKPTIDGRLDEAMWQETEWTSEFVDISTDVQPRKATRAKIRWDKDFLYIGARLEEDEIWANVEKHDEVIFKDNDFEVFLDPAGSSHYYKEFEVNARGVTWDLCLNKPYSNGGSENSGRTHGSQGWESDGQAAVFVEGGVLNDAKSHSKAWTVEIALPIAKLLVNQTEPGALSPGNGRYWRINFSRVEWRVLRSGDTFIKDPAFPNEDNWVWSKMGEVNMHLPERWGILQFSSEAPGTATLVRDPEWRVRHVAASLYDAQHKWAKAHDGKFTADLESLKPLMPAGALDGSSCTGMPSVTLGDGGQNFLATVPPLEKAVSPRAATIREDRLLTLSQA